MPRSEDQECGWVRGRSGGEFLSPLRGFSYGGPSPTACAVGCILSPLRGWLRRRRLRSPCGVALPDLTSLAERGIMIGKHIVLTLVVGGALCALFWQRSPAEWTAVRIVGVCLIAVGFVLWTVARFQLGASFAVTAQARQLVTRGLYSKIRNPVYTFGSCVIAGAILVFTRPIALLVFVLIIPMQIWRAGKESAVLEAAFGEEYRKYRAGTWF